MSLKPESWLWREAGYTAETPKAQSFEGNPSQRPRHALRSNRGGRETGCVRCGLFGKLGRSAEQAEGAEFQIWFLGNPSQRPRHALRSNRGGRETGCVRCG